MNLKKFTIAAFLLSTTALRADAVGDLITMLAGAGYTNIEVSSSAGLYYVEADLNGLEYHMVYDPAVGPEPISVTVDDNSNDGNDDASGDDGNGDDGNDDDGGDDDDDSNDDGDDHGDDDGDSNDDGDDHGDDDGDDD